MDEHGYSRQILSAREMWDDVAVLIETRAETLQDAAERLEPLQVSKLLNL